MKRSERSLDELSDEVRHFVARMKRHREMLADPHRPTMTAIFTQHGTLFDALIAGVPTEHVALAILAPLTTYMADRSPASRTELLKHIEIIRLFGLEQIVPYICERAGLGE